MGSSVFLFGSAVAGAFATPACPARPQQVSPTIVIGRGVTVIAVLAVLLLALMTVYVKSQLDSHPRHPALLGPHLLSRSARTRPGPRPAAHYGARP